MLFHCPAHKSSIFAKIFFALSLSTVDFRPPLSLHSNYHKIEQLNFGCYDVLVWAKVFQVHHNCSIATISTRLLLCSICYSNRFTSGLGVSFSLSLSLSLAYSIVTTNYNNKDRCSLPPVYISPNKAIGYSLLFSYAS